MAKQPIVHIELPAEDRMAAAKFYSDLFGWDIQDAPEMNYATFHDGSLGGGFNPLSNDVEPGDVIIYINSDDVLADLERIEAAGGKTVMPKMDVGDLGYIAWFSDPTGNVVGLFESVPDAG
jgi:predicted enzyme related to lactoylglutathione lyase